MKKLFILVLFVGFLSGVSNAQMQASLGAIAGTNDSSIIIYIRPTAAVNSTLSTLQFSVGIPATTIPIPTMAITTVFLGSGWQISPSYIEGGFRLFDITNSASPTVAIAAGAESQVLQLRFIGGQKASNAALVTLSGGGAMTGNALFLSTSIEVSAQSVEGSLYYTRPGTTIINNSSYTGPLPSEARIAGVLPIRLTSFNAIKNNQDALVTWTVENQDANADRFEVERSFNGIDFKYIGMTNAAATGSNFISYNYIDRNITSLNSGGIIYYRLKSFDKDGSFLYSQIKNIRVSEKYQSITVYPNPVRDFTTVEIDSPTQQDITINLINIDGKMLQTVTIKANKGINTKKINLNNYPAGNYLLKVTMGSNVQTIKIIKN